MIGALALAFQLSIVAHAPDTVAACEAFEVSVAVQVSGPVPPYVIPPSFGPFDVLRSSPTPLVTGSGGSGLAEFRYVLTTERAGRFTLGPFEARANGQVGKSRPLSIVVRQTPISERVPTVVARARVDTSLEVNFRALALPETVFVGQQANYEVAVFLNETVRDRLRRNPTFFPPDMQSMLAYDIPSKPGEPPRRKVGSRCFDALVYQRALFPLLPGRFVIPPAQLSYSLPLSASFFSREESHELRTDSTVIVALEPPEQGRPADYNGAVGDLTVSTDVDTARARVGDPIVLTVRVNGTGNVKLLPRPQVSIPWASLVNGDERVSVDTTARKIRGSKEFDWLLTPKIAGELDVPPVRYPYFNPDRRSYDLAISAPRRLHVAAGSLAAVDTLTRDRILSLREHYRGPLSPPAHKMPIFWALIAVAPLPALGLRLRRRPKRVSTRPPASRLRALAKSTSRDPCELRRLFVGALGDRLGLHAELFTRPGALAHALRRSGVSTEIAADSERFLRALDEAAYSSSGTLSSDAASRAVALFDAADSEALPRAELRLPASLVVLFVLLTAGAAMAASPADEALDSFTKGIAQYQEQHYAVARDHFMRSARIEPAAPDAWANAGTAAWAAGDTATAVLGWQRALRLEPLARDARSRLNQIHSSVLGSTGFVAPVSPSMLAWAALVFWCAAWMTTALRLRRGARGRSPIAVLGVLATVCALMAIELNDRIDGRQLRVVRHSSRLSAVAAMGGETVASAETGEIAHVIVREGSWTRVALDNGREGWVATENLIPLAWLDAPAN